MTDSQTESASVRYHVTDVGRSIAFYTERLGFTLQHRAGDAFAAVARGPLVLLLGGPTSSGSRPLPDGTAQVPGGYNRIVLYVADLDAWITRLRDASVPFRGNIEKGPGGSQIQVIDPDGNPVELHQPPTSR